MQTKNKNNDYNQLEDEQIDLRKLVEQYAYYWKWFVFSIIAALLLAVVYLKFTTKQYEVNAQILLSEKGSKSSQLDAVTDAALGNMSGGSNSAVLDQITILKSRRFLLKVVNQNKLYVKYKINKGFESQEKLEKDAPLKLVVLNDSIKYSEDFKDNIKIEILSSTQFKVLASEHIKSETYQFGQKITTKSLGEILFLPNTGIATSKVSQVLVSVNPVMNVVNNLRKNMIIASADDKRSMIVNFSLVDNLKERAILIIDNLIKVYNDDIDEDNSKLAEVTTMFINERLKVVSGDLASVDQNLEKFKKENQLTNAEAEAEIFLKDASVIDKTILDNTTQLQIAKHLRQNLASPDHNLLPTNIGIQDISLNQSINAYNELVLEKEEYKKSMTGNNPVMESLNKNIADLKNSIQSSLSIYQNNIQTSLDAVQNKREQIASKLSTLPQQERGFRDISRQQQIVESIYLFLLQKREEAEIKAAAKPDSVKVIDQAYADNNPVNPKSMIVGLIAIALGFLIPFAIIYLKMLLDNKIKDKEDFKKSFDGPILGEIPKSSQAIIEHNDRSSTAEAFRILRSNLNFLLPKNTATAKVVFVTSTIAGEGKSFISVNLSQILSMTNKKVLLIGADIRAPKLLSYLNLSNKGYTPLGLSNYLADESLTVENILISQPGNYKFDLIHSGVIPPNPSELLLNNRFSEIVDYGNENYDFIIVDSAPVSLVDDTLAIAKLADVTLYVARSNYLDKRFLPFINEMRHSKKLYNMAVIINDVNYDKGYGYGRGYGYGYGELHVKKNKWNIFKKN